MIRNSREKKFQRKQDSSFTDQAKASSKSSSRPWSHRNPRIVCVPPSFGGKDRHSKVSTVRGLRDRRVRLSVPTAIKLYDLQDRLGLNQPSKVVDWLLNAAQHEIDKLPPLQPLPPNNYMHSSSQPLVAANDHDEIMIHNRSVLEDLAALSKAANLNSDAFQLAKQKETMIELMNMDRNVWDDNNLLSNYNSYHCWEASNTINTTYNGPTPIPVSSSLSLAPGSDQLGFHDQSAETGTAMFSSSFANAAADMDMKQYSILHFPSMGLQNQPWDPHVRFFGAARQP